MFRTTRFLGVFALLAACSGPPDEGPPTSGVAELDDAVVELNTFITESLQIDELGGGPGDANMFVGDDPADGSASADVPAGGPATFLDWEDLAADIDNHRLVDTDVGKTDPSSFPLSNECVGASNVLSKMDLTYVASANNDSYAYLAVQRSANNGDAGYYWLFTKKAPRMVLGGGSCSAAKGHRQLLYDISGPDPATGLGGDVLIRGHFKPSADIPLLTVYRSTSTIDGVTAYDAIDFESGMWAEDAAGVAAVAVNTTIMDAGTFGTDGVKSMSGPYLDTELFAEAAVPLSVFTQGSVCDATFFGSVITRSSGAGGTTPDLKDLAGPALFNFGTATAEAEMTPTCQLEAGYRVLSATGADGAPIVDPICHWTFSDGSASDACDGVAGFTAPGSYGATLTVTDPVSQCVAAVDVAAVDVWDPLVVEANLDATCESVFDYAATVSGGSTAGVTYQWAFTSPDGVATPATSTAPSGTAAVVPGGVDYTGTVTVRDLRADLADCTATDSDVARPYDPLGASLSPTAEADTCPDMATDAAVYLANPSGGSGNYTFTWVPAGCSGATCTVDPDDSAFCVPRTEIYVTVADDSGLCAPAQSESEFYEKVTTVTWTDN